MPQLTINLIIYKKTRIMKLQHYTKQTTNTLQQQINNKTKQQNNSYTNIS